jgi:hypothetical protein
VDEQTLIAIEVRHNVLAAPTERIDTLARQTIGHIFRKWPPEVRPIDRCLRDYFTFHNG